MGLASVIQVAKQSAPGAALQSIFRWLVSAASLAEAQPLRVVLRLILFNSIVMTLCVLVGLASEYAEAGRYFREGRLMTWISTFQLLAVGYICIKVFALENTSPRWKLSCPESIWWLTAYGFFFLAFDEIMKVHEAIDRYTHKIIGVAPTGSTDHFDDLIVAIYGAAGIVLLALYWRQIPRFLGCIGYVLAASACSALSILLDFASGDRTLLLEYSGSSVYVGWYMTWLGLLEEVFKIYAEVFFIGAALYCFHRALAYRKSLCANLFPEPAQ